MVIKTVILNNVNLTVVFFFSFSKLYLKNLLNRILRSEFKGLFFLDVYVHCLETRVFLLFSWSWFS